VQGGKRQCVLVLPLGREVQALLGEGLLEALTRAGIPLRSDCGGLGICGRCRVRFQGEAPAPTASERRCLSEEELNQGWRLACQHRVTGDIVLELPVLGEVPQGKVQLELGAGETHPLAERKEAKLPAAPPSMLEALEEALEVELEPTLSFLRALPKVARGGSPLDLTLIRRKPLSARAHKVASGPYGIALDLGTTTLAAYLIDLGMQRKISAFARFNPQRRYGADVLSRIHYVQQYGEKGIRELRSSLLEELSGMIRDLLGPSGIKPEEVVVTTVVGNPTMLHLFLGVDPRGIGEAPFTPVWRKGLTFLGREVGLPLHPEGEVYLFPLVSGYVGADTVAGVLATGLHRRDELALFLDLGTNGEIVLGGKRRLMACSAAAGPAFEGGRIVYGMPAVEGAIAHVDLDGGELSLQVIGEGEPTGLCGTGLVDLVAVLLEANLVDPTGRLTERPQSPFFEKMEGLGKERRFSLSDKVALYQGDVRELQLAKAALRAGIEVLLERMRVSAEEVDRVYLAGAFGSEMRPESLARIGLLPEELTGKTVLVGNAAGLGAALALLNAELLSEAERIARSIEYIELSREAAFSRKFVAHMKFPQEVRKR